MLQVLEVVGILDLLTQEVLVERDILSVFLHQHDFSFYRRFILQNQGHLLVCSQLEVTHKEIGIQQRDILTYDCDELVMVDGISIFYFKFEANIVISQFVGNAADCEHLFFLLFQGDSFV